ncbi:hypothetical protein TIFTF001_053662 [Ficus carica]|uniref:Uncharacterized protein n=1 Tax=Ficus carica TaxID=3494 RepID=A0AA88JDW5_FICCA|nr:hypothetical protein TIFTF001_053662 [Ficus carica]
MNGGETPFTAAFVAFITAEALVITATFIAGAVLNSGVW